MTIEALAAAVRARRARPGARRPVARRPAGGGRRARARRRPGRHAGRRIDRHRRRPDPRGARGSGRPTVAADEGQGAGGEELQARQGQAGPREAVARRASRWRIARHVAALLLFCYAGYRAVNLVVARRAAAGRPHRRHGQRAAVERRSAGADPRALRAQHPDRGPGRRAGGSLLDSPWVADAALRRVLPSTIEVRVVERQPIGHLPARQPAVSDRSVRHGDRRVRPAVPRVRPADHRRPGAVAEEGQAGDRRGARRARGARDRLGRDAQGDRQRGCRRSTSPTRTTSSCCSTAIRRCCTSATSGSSSACSRISRSRRRSASGCRTSTTSICGSTIACT